MRGAALRRMACAVWLPLLLATAARADQARDIGSWELTCPAAGGCTLRAREWVLPPGPGRPAAALEVQSRGQWLVPVVTLRGLTTQQALGGLLALQPRATLRFDSGPTAELPCELSGQAVVCAPQGDAVAATAAALPTAHSIAVGLQLGAPGMMQLPSQGRTLALQGTATALDQLRSAGAVGEALPAEPGLDWIGFVDRIMQAIGITPAALHGG